MKKTLSLALAMLMLCTAVLALASCNMFSTYSAIEKRFTDAEWEVVDTTGDDGENVLDFVADLDGDGEVKCEAHILKKNVFTYVIVLEFGADADAQARLDELLTEDDVSMLIKADEKSDYINGNCVLIPFTVTAADEAKELFQG